MEVSFDEETLELSFDWTNIKTTTAKAAFTFSGDYPEYVFSGSINPRQQDGPVGFSGNNQ
ncbi:hypothetical protein WJR50_06015 [Catalinimonas sp. 4WD22]|uniref:hypothetical protein n=1 Tax=Catalinimonas locisalis TaxID=3133978 RepID=UPI003101404C